MAKQMFSVRVEPELLERVDKAAQAAGASRSAWVTGVLGEAVGVERGARAGAKGVEAGLVRAERGGAEFEARVEELSRFMAEDAARALARREFGRA